jgi:hypothetical protein
MEFKTYEYVVFSENRLNNSKVVINCDKTLPHDFEITDEVSSLDFPYLYFLNGY